MGIGLWLAFCFAKPKGASRWLPPIYSNATGIRLSLTAMPNSMVTQAEHEQNIKAEKFRQHMINKDLAEVNKGEMTPEEIYHLGMDMGIRIGEKRI